MTKSVFGADYAVFRAHLRATRKAAGLTQRQLAERLNETQSFVSKCERGERRLDVMELRAFCQAMGVPLLEFVQGLEDRLREPPRAAR